MCQCSQGKERCDCGLCYIPTEPGALEDDRHSTESMGMWICYAVCVGVFGFVIGKALAWW